MKKYLKSIIIAGLALAVSLFGITSPIASAEDGVISAPAGNTIYIDHEYYVVSGAAPFGIEFDVDYVTEEEHGNTTFDYDYIGAVGISGLWDYQHASGSNCTPVADSALAVCKNPGRRNINLTNFLGVVPHAGVYLFEITQKQLEDMPIGGSTGQTITGSENFSKIKESQAVYELRVYVKNSGTGHEIEYVTITQTKDDNGVDLADENGDYPKADNLLFKTMWEDRQPLEVSKAVTGDYASKQTPFQFSLTLSNPSFTTSSYTGRVLDATGAFVENITATIDTPTTFELKHGWKLVFEDNDVNATNALPAGTQYEITEVFSEGYTATVSVNGAADATTTVPSGCTEKCDTVLSGATVISNATNTAAWTNTYRTISPTGIIMNSLPYILIIVTAIAGFAGYIILRRKQAKK